MAVYRSAVPLPSHRRGVEGDEVRMSPLSDADLRGAVEAADRDVTGEGGEADARGLVELDRAVRALEGDVAEPSDGPEFGAGRLRLDAGTAGQLDRHLDGSGAAEDLVVRRGLDQQRSAIIQLTSHHG